MQLAKDCRYCHLAQGFLSFLKYDKKEDLYRAMIAGSYQY